MRASLLQGEYILNAGLEAGLELPFTCKGGICGCCVGRVAEGEIDQSDVRRSSQWPRAGRAGNRPPVALRQRDGALPLLSNRRPQLQLNGRPAAAMKGVLPKHLPAWPLAADC